MVDFLMADFHVGISTVFGAMRLCSQVVLVAWLGALHMHLPADGITKPQWICSSLQAMIHLHLHPHPSRLKRMTLYAKVMRRMPSMDTLPTILLVLGIMTTVRRVRLMEMQQTRGNCTNHRDHQ